MRRKGDRLPQSVVALSDGSRSSRSKLLLLASLALNACLVVVLLVTNQERQQHQQQQQQQQQYGSSSDSRGVVHLPAPPAPAAEAAASAASITNPSLLATEATPTAAAAWEGHGPFRFPRLIHQTVADKDRLSCQQRQVIQSWKQLNPGYEHRLWDDASMRAFMAQHYPQLLALPYDAFLNAAERTDLWRILVLHKLGGVYADMDVQCLQPVDSWNAAHAHDASLLLGVENYDTSRPEPLHVVNWVLAALPGHPLLGKVPGVVAAATQAQFFEAARHGATLDKKAYEGGILDRTGPAALTRAMYEHFADIGHNLSRVSYDNVTAATGVVAGGARLLPIDRFASGWEVAESRRKGSASSPVSCADLGKRVPTALVCHMFWGSWRTSWSFAQQHTYDNC